MEPDDAKPFQDSQNNTPVQRFLARHVPTQLANPRKLCYRHRPDLARLRGPDEYNFTDVQKVKCHYSTVIENFPIALQLTYSSISSNSFFLHSKWINFDVQTKQR